MIDIYILYTIFLSYIIKQIIDHLIRHYFQTWCQKTKDNFLIWAVFNEILEVSEGVVAIFVQGSQ